MTLEPFITLLLFSVWLSYFSKKEGHLLSRVSFSEAIIGFLIVMAVVFAYKINVIAQDAYSYYVFFSAVGIFWGTLGLMWGLVFYMLPIEKLLKVNAPKRKAVKRYKYPRPLR